MKKILGYIFALILIITGLVSCADENVIPSGEERVDAIKMGTLRAAIYSGEASARAVTPLADSIGRHVFVDKDEVCFTSIRRTNSPIPDFTYSNVHYKCTNFDKDTTSLTRNIIDAASEPADIYWSDGYTPHTFIGYLLPHEDGKTPDESHFDWNKTGDTYYGSIGSGKDDTAVDYTGGDPGADISGAYSNEKLRKEDLLLTYDTNLMNEDAIAWIRFHHALSSVRVMVTITGFSSTGNDADAESKVKNMVLKNQPVMYKWRGNSYKAESLTQEDQANLSSVSSEYQWDRKVDMNLWQPRVSKGSGAGRTFSFYAITAPSMQEEVTMTFEVEYPNPLQPNAKITKPYTATLKLDGGNKVEFRAGYCTSINVNLNHKDEKMTIGAEYMSWEYEPAPDEGSLRKNSTFLADVNRSSVTILGDTKATVDDATWLYASSDGTIKDIYGHTGTAADPFRISTADQLLSFAYEVNGTSRTALSIKNTPESSTTKSLDGGFDFTGYHIKLDAGLTLQASVTGDVLSWPGIGAADKPFNGSFQAGLRSISRLKGNALFLNLGANAQVCSLILEKVLGMTGTGSIAEVNNGTIGGCKVEGDVNSTNTGNVGSLVGTNNGLILACCHIGDVEGTGDVAGLSGAIGTGGKMVACYNTGLIKSNGTGKTVWGIAVSTPSPEEECIIGCYFDISRATENDESISIAPSGSDATYPSGAKTTSEMKKSDFAGTLNGVITGWTTDTHLRGHGFTARAANYPDVH